MPFCSTMRSISERSLPSNSWLASGAEGGKQALKKEGADDYMGNVGLGGGTPPLRTPATAGNAIISGPE